VHRKETTTSGFSTAQGSWFGKELWMPDKERTKKPSNFDPFRLECISWKSKMKEVEKFRN
jgi:hypothetical protein